MLTIHKAQPEDAGLLHQMGYTSYRHHFAHLWHEKQEMEAFLEQEYALPVLDQSLRDAACCWLIAATDKPVGFAKFSFRQPVTPQGPAGTLLHKLYFLPGMTGKSYGERLFEAVVCQARARGEAFLWLEVLAANPQARRFYERQGLRHLHDTVFGSASQQSTLHILGRVI